MRQINNLGDVKPVVVIGGKNEKKFVPNLNMSFFDDEFFININRKNKVIENETAATASGKTSLGGDDADIWYIDETGRLKWDIDFTTHPGVYSWDWALKHTNGLEFYYQGELTPEEITEGAIRPDEVVGSYAVYCDKANNKYKTGKICHIYAPIFIDANGSKQKGTLLIDKGKSLTISIDKTWFDNAVFPVTLDPTFGYATKGGSSIGGDNSVAWGTRFTPSGAGTATSISSFVYSGGSYNWKFALYAYGTPATLKAGTVEGSGELNDWSTLNLSSSQSITTDEHVLYLQGDNANVRFYYDNGSANQQGYAQRTYSNAWESSLSTSFENALKFSIYSTSGGGSLPAIINNHRQQGAM